MRHLFMFLALSLTDTVKIIEQWKGYFNLEQWSKNVCGISSPVCPHIVLPPSCPLRHRMFSHAYARVQSSKDSQVEHLIRYDQLFEYHEALAFENRELCYVGSTSNADRTFDFDIPDPDDAAIGSLINATAKQDDEHSTGEIIPKEITLDEFCNILGIS